MTAYVRILSKEEGDARLSEAARKYTWLSSEIARIASAEDVHYYILFHELNQNKLNMITSLVKQFDTITKAISQFGSPLIYFPIRPGIYDAYLSIEFLVDNEFISYIAKNLRIDIYNPIKHEFNQMRSSIRPGSFIQLLTYAQYIEMMQLWLNNKDIDAFPETKEGISKFKNLTDHRFIVSLDASEEHVRLIGDQFDKLNADVITFHSDTGNKHGFIIPIAPQEDAEALIRILSQAFGLEIYQKKETIYSKDRSISIISSEAFYAMCDIVLEKPCSIDHMYMRDRVQQLRGLLFACAIRISNLTTDQAQKFYDNTPTAITLSYNEQVTVLLPYGDTKRAERDMIGYARLLKIPIHRAINVPVVPGQKVTPEMAIERVQRLKELLIEYHSEISERSEWSATDDPHPDNTAERIATIPENLGQAVITLWKEDMWNAGVSGCDAFIGTELDRETINLNPAPAIWMWDHILAGIKLPIKVDWQLPEGYDNIAGIYITQSVQVDDNSPYRAAWGRFTVKMPYSDINNSISKGEIKNIGLRFSLIFSSKTSNIPVLRCLPPIYAGDKISDYQAMLIAALKFMHIDLVVKEPLRPARPFRRRAEREKRKLQEVHTIYLRRLKHMDKKHVENEGEGEHVKREYAVQWLVGGHWRNQFYSSTGTHKMIYISPYLKGPEDMPFKAPGARVYKVAR